MDYAGHELHPSPEEQLAEELVTGSSDLGPDKHHGPLNDEVDSENENGADGETYEDEDNDSEYSLDYEFAGPRHCNYRDENDPDSDVSELSDTEDVTPRFDMWDDDPYSINDFGWDANDMRLTMCMKRKLAELLPRRTSFWRKDKGCPRQLPYSSSTTNHDQSANALCLLQSDYGARETLFAVYRDRIIECGRPPHVKKQKTKFKAQTTWIDSDVSELTETPHGPPTKAEVDQFCQNNLSVSHRPCQPSSSSSSSSSSSFSSCSSESHTTSTAWCDASSRLARFTKYIKRTDFTTQDAYVSLGFEPQCLAVGYGYMGIGGVEGEFELYCCMPHHGDSEPRAPLKIWGTMFKSKNNVMLMTNAIEFARLGDQHLLIACMNEAGILIYELPPHECCQNARRAKLTTPVRLHSHLRCFDGVAINDAKLSPDQRHLVCVGDDAAMFLLNMCYHDGGQIEFNPKRLFIPSDLLHGRPYSSQYVAWSHSSRFFAHTSDTHNVVLVWCASTCQLLYSIDAASYTYAIAFHPSMEGILVFTNRYGYFHTVNLDDFTVKTPSIRTSEDADDEPRTAAGVSTLNFEKPTSGTKDNEVKHFMHLQTRHEITMVAFRGERDRRLRILAKINGIQWSRHGRYLYVATKKRVLAYEFMPVARHVLPLSEIAGKQLCKQLDAPYITSKRKRFHTIADSVPHHLLARFFASTPLASHW